MAFSISSSVKSLRQIKVSLNNGTLNSSDVTIVVNNHDVVPAVPVLAYKHAGGRLRLQRKEGKELLADFVVPTDIHTCMLLVPSERIMQQKG